MAAFRKLKINKSKSYDSLDDDVPIDPSRNLENGFEENETDKKDTNRLGNPFTDFYAKAQKTHKGLLSNGSNRWNELESEVSNNGQENGNTEGKGETEDRATYKDKINGKIAKLKSSTNLPEVKMPSQLKVDLKNKIETFRKDSPGADDKSRDQSLSIKQKLRNFSKNREQSNDNSSRKVENKSNSGPKFSEDLINKLKVATNEKTKDIKSLQHQSDPWNPKNLITKPGDKLQTQLINEEPNDQNVNPFKDNNIERFLKERLDEDRWNDRLIRSTSSKDGSDTKAGEEGDGSTDDDDELDPEISDDQFQIKKNIGLVSGVNLKVNFGNVLKTSPKRKKSRDNNASGTVSNFQDEFYNLERGISDFTSKDVTGGNKPKNEENVKSKASTMKTKLMKDIKFKDIKFGVSRKNLLKNDGNIKSPNSQELESEESEFSFEDISTIEDLTSDAPSVKSANEEIGRKHSNPESYYDKVDSASHVAHNGSQKSLKRIQSISQVLKNTTRKKNRQYDSVQDTCDDSRELNNNLKNQTSGDTKQVSNYNLPKRFSFTKRLDSYVEKEEPFSSTFDEAKIDKLFEKVTPKQQNGHAVKGENLIDVNDHHTTSCNVVDILNFAEPVANQCMNDSAVSQFEDDFVKFDKPTKDYFENDFNADPFSDSYIQPIESAFKQNFDPFAESKNFNPFKIDHNGTQSSESFGTSLDEPSNPFSAFTNDSSSFSGWNVKYSASTSQLAQSPNDAFEDLLKSPESVLDASSDNSANDSGFDSRDLGDIPSSYVEPKDDILVDSSLSFRSFKNKKINKHKLSYSSSNLAQIEERPVNYSAVGSMWDCSLDDDSRDIVIRSRGKSSHFQALERKATHLLFW